MTASFLDDVVPAVRAAVGSGSYDRGVPVRPPRNPVSLRRAIERDREHGALLVEYKRASPGATTPLPAARSVPAFLAATEAAGITGYSCLATAYGFDGSPGRVAELAGLTRNPVLFKEFVLSPTQIDVAARTGAAAVLLIARLEGEGALERPLSELARAAHRRGLEVVLELHATDELSRLGGVEADVYGVNCRDLATLRLERDAAYATLAELRARGLGPRVGLSGVAGPEDAEAFWSRGCDALLVGSAVARSDDPAAFLRTLHRREARN